MLHSLCTISLTCDTHHHPQWWTTVWTLMDSAVFVVLSFADHKDSPVMHGELSCSFQLLPGTGKVVCSFLEVVEVSSKVIQESCDDVRSFESVPESRQTPSSLVRVNLKELL